jgi:hypothetical protein
MAFIDAGEFPNNSVAGVSVRADFERLVVKNNTAVISGQITDSSVGDLIGHRVLLVVEAMTQAASRPASTS